MASDILEKASPYTPVLGGLGTGLMEDRGTVKLFLPHGRQGTAGVQQLKAAGVALPLNLLPPQKPHQEADSDNDDHQEKPSEDRNAHN